MAGKRGEAPRWMRRHVQKCRAAFGIGDAGFALTLTLADAPNPANADTVGLTSTSVRYHRGDVMIKRGLRRGDLGYETVTHEMLHAASAMQLHAVTRILELVPEDLRDHAEALWQDGNEATVTQLARALTPVLRAVRRTKEKTNGRQTQ